MSGPTSAVAHLRMDAREQFSELYQETMENLVIHAETVSTIAQPSEPMPSVRSGACSSIWLSPPIPRGAARLLGGSASTLPNQTASSGSIVAYEPRCTRGCAASCTSPSW